MINPTASQYRWVRIAKYCVQWKAVKREIAFVRDTKSAGRNCNVLPYRKRTGIDVAFVGEEQRKRTALEHFYSPELKLKLMLDCQM